MKKLFYSLFLLVSFSTVGLAQSQCVDVEEIDGSPKAPCIRQMKVTNGTLNCPTPNRCTLTISGGGGSGITIGTTTANGTAGRVLYTDGSFVQAYPVTGSGNAVLSASPTLTGIVPITSTVTTGTGTSSGFSVAADSLTTGAGANFASSSVTTGSVVNIASTSTAAASSTLKGLNIAISGANGTTAQTVTGASISVTNTNATSGTNIGLSVAASGATTTNRAIEATAGGIFATSSTGTLLIGIAVSGQPTVGIGRNGSLGGLDFYGNTTARINLTDTSLALASVLNVGWCSGVVCVAPDLVLRRSAAAKLAFGAADAAAPVAQTMSVQNVVAGTSNTAGANWTHAGSRGTGTGVGGDIVFQTAPAGSTGSTQNTLVTAFTVKGDGATQLKSVTFTNLPTVANGYLIYCSDCTLASPCASGGTGALAKGINSAWVCN